MLYFDLSLMIYCAVLFQGLDEQQSVQLLQCYLQSDYRGTQQSLKVFVTFFQLVLQNVLLHVMYYYFVLLMKGEKSVFINWAELTFDTGGS